MQEKEIKFTKHAVKRADERGVTHEEIKEAIKNSNWLKATHDRYTINYLFNYNKIWEGKFYKQKEIVVIFKEENDKIVVITTIARYFTR